MNKKTKVLEYVGSGWRYMDSINYIAFKGTVERWRAILTNSGCNGSYDYHLGHLQTYDYTTGSYTYVHCLGEAYTGN